MYCRGFKKKYEKFWGVVAEYIDDKPAVGDRRHSLSSGYGEKVVNMALALSYADLYRTCVDIASSKDSDIQIPTYQWFLLQFWPTSKSQSRILQYTGRFNVKRMVQSRVLRKDNPDMHYTNAIYSFPKERAQFNSSCCAMVSADGKCKVLLGEPGEPAYSRGKKRAR